ncbi:MAG TPA: beta-1,6-N-acetylglucosaminyltransferase, partial [Puia sp.]|nr:beta-1,6-N-acetylglucosaminyltransferase [Puia sp.]
MRIAYLIMAHKNPTQIEKLIHKLRHPQFDVYIHLDKKTDIGDYEYLSNIRGVYFITNRTKVTWGGISIPDAVFVSMGEVLS